MGRPEDGCGHPWGTLSLLSLPPSPSAEFLVLLDKVPFLPDTWSQMSLKRSLTKSLKENQWSMAG